LRAFVLAPEERLTETNQQKSQFSCIDGEIKDGTWKNLVRQFSPSQGSSSFNEPINRGFVLRTTCPAYRYEGATEAKIEAFSTQLFSLDDRKVRNFRDLSRKICDFVDIERVK
jgi:hypothetical protein